MTPTSVPGVGTSEVVADTRSGGSETSETPSPSSGVVRYWAAAREAAGTDSESFSAATLAEALTRAVDARGGAAAGGGRLAQVLARSSFLVDGDPVGTRDHAAVRLGEGVIVEVLPPFAGG